MEEFVNLSNARHDSQREVMETIKDNQECPFCPDHLEKYHKEPIFRKGTHWILTRNQWPYNHTETHLLAIATYHAERLADLQEGSFQELQDHFTWAEKEFDITSGGLAMRFGSIALNGATVNHLHAHLIAPSKDRADDEKVRFKIG